MSETLFSTMTCDRCRDVMHVYENEQGSVDVCFEVGDTSLFVCETCLEGSEAWAARFQQAMADVDMGTKIADMIFGKLPEKKE